MGKVIKSQKKGESRGAPYPGIPAQRYKQEKADWEQAVCSVCLEGPHNAVLLLCSSHKKGCRPYMCGTNTRQSNCLNLFKKSYSKPSPSAEDAALCKKSGPAELCCPLCRGQVMGWTVVKPAREHLNRRKRSCVHEGCSYRGSYCRLKKHVKEEHKMSRARKVDPVLEERWKDLESRTEREDVLSTIRGSMPGSVVVGDYVIDMGGSSSEEDYSSDEDDMFDMRGGLGGRRHGGRSVGRNFFNFLIQQHARHSSRRGQRRRHFWV